MFILTMNVDETESGAGDVAVELHDSSVPDKFQPITFHINSVINLNLLFIYCK